MMGRRHRGHLKRLANRIILDELKTLGIKYSNMKMRDAAAIVARAKGLPSCDKIEIARALKGTFDAACNSKAAFGGMKLIAPQSTEVPNEINLKGEKRFKDFYRSWEWKRLRYDFVKSSKQRCGCCGASAEQARLVVDHIKPIRRYWNLRLDPANLQILCDDCNMGKGSRDETRWSTVAP